MAREYGNERGASITIRVSEHEKEVIMNTAKQLGKSVSEFLRDAAAAYSTLMLAYKISEQKIKEWKELLQ